MMKIIIGSDHAGYTLKEYLKSEFRDIDWVDAGCRSPDMPASYSEIAMNVSGAVHNREYDKGVLVCGTGIGVSMAANRFTGVRAALCTDEKMALMSRKHNNANILCLGARIISESLAGKILSVWLETDFEGGRHLKRIQTMDEPCNV